MPAAAGVRLVGDIGATNARFGLVSPAGELRHSRIYAVEDHPSIEHAILVYLAERGALPMPREGALAIASPITDDRIAMTNHPWSFSVAALRRSLGFERLEVINDFTAVALALPHLREADRMPVGGGAPAAGAPIAVLGPGSGLGVSGLVPTPEGRWVALVGEGGHVGMPPSTERESAVLAHLRRQFDHVSAERVLSGPGLVNLYNALAALERVPAKAYTAAQITDPATGAADSLCGEATRLFCAMLGTIAGDLALTLGARGGVYVAGGIVPKLGGVFAGSPFRERFEAKGRLRTYLAPIPTYVVTHPLPAFIGCAAAERGARRGRRRRAAVRPGGRRDAAGRRPRRSGPARRALPRRRSRRTTRRRSPPRRRCRPPTTRHRRRTGRCASAPGTAARSWRYSRPPQSRRGRAG
jgi:glucokinase